MSSNEDPNQNAWTRFNKMLNQAQESICIEKNEKGDYLMSFRYVTLDFSNNKELFCETYSKHTRDNNLNSIKNTEHYNPTPYDQTI